MSLFNLELLQNKGILGEKGIFWQHSIGIHGHGESHVGGVQGCTEHAGLGTLRLPAHLRLGNSVTEGETGKPWPWGLSP